MKTLWLLIIPVVFVVSMIWFSQHNSQPSSSTQQGIAIAPSSQTAKLGAQLPLVPGQHDCPGDAGNKSPGAQINGCPKEFNVTFPNN